MIHGLNIDDEPYKSIKNGTKTVEQRINDEKMQLLKIKDLIEFTNNETKEMLVVEIQKLYQYASFEELYAHIDKTLLGYKEDEIVNFEDMYKYYTKEEQDKYGVVGIEFKRYKFYDFFKKSATKSKVLYKFCTKK